MARHKIKQKAPWLGIYQGTRSKLLKSYAKPDKIQRKEAEVLHSEVKCHCPCSGIHTWRRRVLRRQQQQSRPKATLYLSLANDKFSSPILASILAAQFVLWKEQIPRRRISRTVDDMSQVLEAREISPPSSTSGDYLIRPISELLG